MGIREENPGHVILAVKKYCHIARDCKNNKVINKMTAILIISRLPTDFWSKFTIEHLQRQPGDKWPRMILYTGKHQKWMAEEININRESRLIDQIKFDISWFDSFRSFPTASDKEKYNHSLLFIFLPICALK